MKLVDGYYVWTKNKDEHELLSEHFKAGEFECHCTRKTCIEQRIAEDLIERLEAVRRAYGKPITVTSGYRCKEHQLDLATDGATQTVKAGNLSTHELGHAADIKGTLISVLLPIVKKHFTSIGTARTFLHVDIRPGVRRWKYA